MKKITLGIFGFLAFSLGAFAQYSFPVEAGPILVAQGTPVTININDAANAAGVPVTDYLSFSVSADWVNDFDAWSGEADLTVTTSAGSVLIDPATSGAGQGAPTTLVFEGEFTALYNPGTDGTLDIVLNQSFPGSSANWSNIVVTINEAPSCIAPSDLAAGDFTSTSAELSWVDAGAAGLYDVEFLDVTAGDVVTGTPTDTGVANPFTKTGLTEGNDYAFYVRADCGGAGVSDWAGPFNFALNLPPANDECDNAVALTVNGDFACGTVTAGTTVGATASPQADDVTGTPNNDVWFSFVATAAAHRIALLNVTAVVGTSTDMGMGVYDSTGGCDGLVLVGDSDPNAFNLSGLTAGVTYLVRVYGWGATNSAQANFDICIGTTPPPPANDECDNAVALTVNGDFACGNVTAGTTASATASPQADDVTGTPNNDVWFSFVATGEIHRIALLNVTAVAGTSTDMGMGVYDSTGGCDGLVLVDDSDPNTLNLSGLTAGVTYLVRVYGWADANSAQANFNICIGTPPPPPANDDFANAAPIACGDNVTGDTTFATLDEDDAPDGFAADMDAPNVWYVLDSSVFGAGEVTINMCPSGYDTSFLVYTGTSGNLTIVGGNDDGGTTNCPAAGTRSFGTFNIDGVQLYYIAVEGWNFGSTGAYDLTLTCAQVCTADAGTLTADANPVLLDGLTTISATPNGDIVVPTDYEVTYVLTEGPTLVIQGVSTTAPSFDVTEVGDYTIHTLVAETSDNADPNYLDLSVVEIGVTTGGDVLDIIDNNDLCASLDVTGAPIIVADCLADAGTLTADANPVVLVGTATISATPNGDIVVPTDYEVIYVLTSGTTLIIEDVSTTAPSFDVTVGGDYTIHTLVAETSDNADPDYLDLSVVQIGVTTGGDVLDIINNNDLCASLDVAGAPISVIDITTLDELLVVDLSTANEVTVIATTGLSAATASGTDLTGFLLADFFGTAGTQTLAATLVSGNLTSASETPDNSPLLSRGGSGTDAGLNIWSYTDDPTSNFTVGELAFTGQATWTLSVDVYNAFLTAPTNGLIYFPADTSDDIAGATLIGTYSVTTVPLSVSDLEINEFSYYPNPVKNVLNISSQQEIERVTVFNMLGQSVLKVTPNATTSEIDMSTLGAGTYFAQVTINDSVKTVKIVKQ